MFVPTPWRIMMVVVKLTEMGFARLIAVSATLFWGRSKQGTHRVYERILVTRNLLNNQSHAVS